jgi:hypothetical protein
MPTASAVTSLTLDDQLVPAGAAATSFARLWRSLWSQPYLAPELLELCRLTLARLHRDQAELEAANPFVPAAAAAARRAAVRAGDAYKSDRFTAAEKALLEFTESYALDAQSISDAQAARVRDTLGEPGLVFLIEALGCLDGRIRTARCLRDLTAGSAFSKEAASVD